MKAKRGKDPRPYCCLFCKRPLSQTTKASEPGQKVVLLWACENPHCITNRKSSDLETG